MTFERFIACIRQLDPLIGLRDLEHLYCDAAREAILIGEAHVNLEVMQSSALKLGLFEQDYTSSSKYMYDKKWAPVNNSDEQDALFEQLRHRMDQLRPSLNK